VLPLPGPDTPTASVLFRHHDRENRRAAVARAARTAASRPDALYSVSLYTFNAWFPFQPLRMIPEPLQLPNMSRKPPHPCPTVVFPCGCILRDGKFWVRYGLFDRECRVACWDAEELERALESV
jgi:predicted GH43/DUF377 family glycosyl hydrolase